MSNHSLDCPFLTATQARMVKRFIASPSGVLFFAVEKDQDAPAQEKNKSGKLEAKSVFRICQTAHCVHMPPAGRSFISKTL